MLAIDTGKYCTLRKCIFTKFFFHNFRGFWNSFIDGLQRVLIFTTDDEVNDRIKADNSYSLPLFEASVSLRNVGLSLVDNLKNRELAYIAITQSVHTI